MFSTSQTREPQIKFLMLPLAILLMLIGAPKAWSEQFTCPMHPHYIANEFGACPICGMDLVPMATEELSDGEANEHSTDQKKAITISPEIIQNIGVRSAPAEEAYFGKNIRSFGVVTENKRFKHAITGRVAGWIEMLAITAEGDNVNSGQILFTLYSPELLSAQQDYLAALSTRNTGRIYATAQRLVSMGVGDQVLEQLKKTRERIEKVPFFAVVDGVVSELMIAQGSYIKPGSPIATIQSYKSVWVNVAVAEKDLEFLDLTTKATVTFPNLGNTELIAHVDYIHPTIEESSRTGKVRLVLANKNGALKPGTYADILFETQVDKRLSIPSEAILRSAEGDFVVVTKGEGRFQSQRVQTGIRSQGRTEILQGLTKDESVLVSSQFLIDSESSLRESFRKLQRLQKSLADLEVTKNQLAMIDHLVDAALHLHETLITASAPKPHLLEPALALNEHLLPAFRGTKLQFILEDSEKTLRNAQAVITMTERAQALANLVDTLKPWILEGKPEYYRTKGLRLFLDHGTGLHWLQLGEAMQHPYGDGHAVEVPIPVDRKLKPAVHDHDAASQAIQQQDAAGGSHAHH